MKPGDYDEDDYLLIHPDGDYRGSGSAQYVSSERREKDRVRLLREVVAEVTRGRIPVPPKRGPRF